MTPANASKRTQSLIDGEFPLTKEDFQHIAGIAMSDAGIDLNEAKASLVYSRLTKRLRALRLESFDSYCALLAREEGSRPDEPLPRWPTPTRLCCSQFAT